MSEPQADRPPSFVGAIRRAHEDHESRFRRATLIRGARVAVLGSGHERDSVVRLVASCRGTIVGMRERPEIVVVAAGASLRELDVLAPDEALVVETDEFVGLTQAYSSTFGMTLLRRAYRDQKRTRPFAAAREREAESAEELLQAPDAVSAGMRARREQLISERRSGRAA